MLVLTSPANYCPHGDVNTVPGELVMPWPIVCDAGRRDDCVCSRTWVGIGSRKPTEVAEVIERDDLTRGDYIELLVAFLSERDSGRWDPSYAEEQAGHLADLAADYTPHTFVRIRLSDDRSNFTFSALEPS